MKIYKFLICLFLPACSANNCGYSQKDNETKGYVKHVTNETPMFCFDHIEAEIDMKTPGVMTSERLRFYVRSQSDAALLRKANVESRQVKIVSDEYRWAWCMPQDVITGVQILEGE